MAVLNNSRSCVVVSDCSTEARNLDFSGKTCCFLNVCNLLKCLYDPCKPNKISMCTPTSGIKGQRLTTKEAEIKFLQQLYYGKHMLEKCHTNACVQKQVPR